MCFNSPHSNLCLNCCLNKQVVKRLLDDGVDLADMCACGAVWNEFCELIAKSQEPGNHKQIFP